MNSESTPAPVAAGNGSRATDQQGKLNRKSSTVALSARQKRFVERARKGPVSRREADRVCGSSNSPDIVFRLRAKGFEIETYRISRVDRDGVTCRPGIFRLISEPEEAEA